MLKILFDTNIILDYFGMSTSAQDCDMAARLVTEILLRTDSFLTTSTSLKDFDYLFRLNMKRIARCEKGELLQEDADAISGIAFNILESIQEICNVVSEGSADVVLAHKLLKQHPDFEDCLLAAVAMRIQANCIVTRDERFIKHCPVSCLTPKDALALITSGFYDDV